MQNDIILTCAVTGAGDTTGKSAHVPVTPKDIAKAAIDAAKAGASIAHIHARDPQTGVGSRDPKLFKEIVDRVRDSNIDIVINELDALFNYDFKNNSYKKQHESINFIRIGTSG